MIIFRRNKYFIRAAHLAIDAFIDMHDDQAAATILKPKKKTIVKKEGLETNTKRGAKKQLRDAAQLEKMEQPLEEALVFLNHLLKIGRHNNSYSDKGTVSRNFSFPIFYIDKTTTHWSLIKHPKYV
jgi:hypothetical protein